MRPEDLVEFKTRPLPPGHYYTTGERYYTMTTQAIIYTRFSPRPNADECKSNEKQLERCMAYRRQKGYVADGHYQDRKVSGSILQRPGLAAALCALKSGMILVVDSSDRLARDMLVNLTIRHEVEKAGATIEYADGSPTMTTPEGTFFQNMMAAVDTYERDRICLRTKKGLEKKRKNGERTTGEIPIGWKEDLEDPKRLVVDRRERKVIIEICEMHANGYPSGHIADSLDILHEMGCRGKPWSPRTIRKLIKRHKFWAGPDGDLSLEPKHP